MNSNVILFLALSVLIASQQTLAQSSAAQAQNRRETCDHLVKPIPSNATTTDRTTTSASSANQNNATTTTTGAPTTTTTTTIETSEGVCTCTCGGSSASPANTTEASAATEGVSESVTSAVSGATVHGEPVDCLLIHYFYEISVLLSGEQYELFIKWIQHIQFTILADVSLSYDEQIVQIGFSLKAFFSEHIEIQEVLYYEKLGSWGFVVDFIYVAYQIQIEITQEIVTFDVSGGCALFDALRNATAGNSELTTIVEELILKITVILKQSAWSYSQQQAQIFLLFQEFFFQYSQFESFFLNIHIEGYGVLEDYFKVCFWYQQIATIDVVIGGDVSDCLILQALTEASQNTSFSNTVRSEFKQLEEKLSSYFAINTNISDRLTYISSECFSFFELVGYMEIFVDQVSCGSWGFIYDIIFCSNVCVNCGCGNPDNGPGTLPPSARSSTVPSMTTEAVSSQASTSNAATSEAATSEAATSQAATSEAATSQAATSEAATSQAATNAVITSEAATSEAATTEAAATEAATTEATTTTAATTTTKTTTTTTTTPTTTTTTTPNTTTPTTTTTSTTTTQATTTTANCKTRWSLLEIQASSNTTYFTNAVGGAYVTWSGSTKASFNTYWIQIRNAIWSTSFTHTEILSKVVTACSSFNKNNAAKQQILFNVTITEWFGTVGQFVACGSTL